ncbi:type IV secretion system protein [Vibrio harveyi]|uniref:type IV secretion system protein n=1 Tax=Vibrio harveyi TaxID=669 RepID=UPI003CF5C0CD
MFEMLFTFVESVIVNNIASMVGLFTKAISGIIGVCVTTYIIYVAWELMFNRQKILAQEVIKTIFSLSLTAGIAFNTPWYMANVVPTILTSGDQITQALMGSASGSGSALQIVFDSVLSDIWKMTDKFIFEFDIEVIATDIGIGAMMIISMLGFVPFIAIATAYLLMAKIMVSFLLIIGPLFIMFAFFPSTRSFFQSWTGQCFNYVLLSILFPLSFSMITALLNVVVFSGNITFSKVIFSAVVFFSLCIVATQIPTLSSTLSGGIGISGLIGNVSSGVGSIAKSASLAGKGFTKGRESYKKRQEKKDKNRLSGG